MAEGGKGSLHEVQFEGCAAYAEAAKMKEKAKVRIFFRGVHEGLVVVNTAQTLVWPPLMYFRDVALPRPWTPVPNYSWFHYSNTESPRDAQQQDPQSELFIYISSVEMLP